MTRWKCKVLHSGIRWIQPAARLNVPFNACLGTLLTFLLTAGCGLDAPRAPRYELDFWVPLGRERISGRDLIEDSDYFGGDSTGAEPIALEIAGTVDDFQVEDLLDVELPGEVIGTTLGSIAIHDVDDAERSFPLSELAGIEVPEGGADVVMRPFTFPESRAALDPQSAFEWLRLANGDVRISLTNRLPVPLGGPGRALSVRIVRRSDNEPAFETTFTDELPAGATQRLILSLAGSVFERDLELIVSGGSAGSGGQTVHVGPEQSLAVEVAFAHLEADSVRALVPTQSIEDAGSVALVRGNDVEIVEAETLRGAIAVRVDNSLPLAVIGELRFNEVRVGPDTLTQSFEIPAAPAGGSSFVNLTFDLASASITPQADGDPELGWSLAVNTPGSAEVVALGRRQGLTVSVRPTTIAFQSITGRMQSRALEVGLSRTTIDLPGGIEQFDLSEAALTLEVENGVALPATASITVDGVPEGGGEPIRLRLDFPIAAAGVGGPVLSTFSIDQQTTPILALLRARPSEIVVQGTLRVGSGEQAVVTRDDTVRGRYRFVAPLRARIGHITHESAPFRFRVDVDAQERIREDLVSAEASGEITNHFPVALVARFAFAAQESGLDSAAVRFAPIEVAPGDVDPLTGRVRGATRSAFRIDIPAEDVVFFARDEVWGEIQLALDGDLEREVEITARDFAEIRGLLRIGYRVAP